MADDNQKIILGIFSILVFLFFVFSTYVLIKLFRLAINWLRWSAGRSKATPTHSLFSFAVAAYFFPGPLIFVLRRGWDFIQEILGSLPSMIQQQMFMFDQACRSPSPAFECIQSVLKTFTASWGLFVINALNRLRIDQFPLLDAVFFTTTWLVLANIVTDPATLQRIADRVRLAFDSLLTGYAAVSSRARADALFFFILAVGAYLSFSSVIAIPSLQEAVLLDANKPEDLKARLKGIALEPNDFNSRFPDISAPTPQQLQPKTSQASSEAAATPKPGEPPPKDDSSSSTSSSPSTPSAEPNFVT